MGSRSEGRAAALQVLYSLDTRAAFEEVEGELKQAREGLLADLPAEVYDFAAEICQGVVEHREAIDEAIEAASERWRLRRMSRVDRNILRVATFELLLCPEVPTKVAINEAIELAKGYGATESRQFVNGILDRVQRVKQDA
ncbi:MAG: transcription antitermination factor NusB [Deltaproteobacteria bacterium]|nr:transcription antitermination factor NusB [Deltaproteobacteria bacterium]